MRRPLEVKLKFYGVTLADGSGSNAPFITINGRQAAHEGPRRVGYCVYCKSQCRGLTANCDLRIYDEAKRAP